jgi:predicted GH43/DUF377 family glycosyl hydrolase
MKYVKKGILFTYKDLKLNYIKSHAMVPSPLKIEEGVYRIYFTSRNQKNQSLIFFFDLDINNGIKILRKSKKPVLKPGLLGSFDDNGVTPCSLVRVNKKTIYMYYIGWKPRSTTRYSLMPGLAISRDNGITFKRYSRAPILSLSDREPYSILTGPYVLNFNNKWHMWYVSCEKWVTPDIPIYNIKYAFSKDGKTWHQTGKICLNTKKNERAVARPVVYLNDNKFSMIYSYEYRKGKKKQTPSYKVGYATSKNGLSWKRFDDHFKIYPSKTGWDSQMVAYGVILYSKNNTIFLYNGNNYGEYAIGYAKLEK